MLETAYDDFHTGFFLEAPPLSITYRFGPRRPYTQLLALSTIRIELFILETPFGNKHIQAENSRLLDLLEVFREFTQKGRLPVTSIIQAQVQSLEKATRAIDNKIKAIKPTQRQPE